jgi:hypothetical protein
MTNFDYSVGDVIEYAAFGGEIRRVRVTVKDDDVKNGAPGFEGTMVDSGMGVWGYNDQITRVVERTAER